LTRASGRTDPPATASTVCPLGRKKDRDHVRRYLARQQSYVQMPSSVYVAVWEGALKNYAPGFGYDYGGRLMAAWLER
jgi:hypothetical protein